MRFDLSPLPIDDDAHDDALRVIGLTARDGGASALLGPMGAALDDACDGALSGVVRSRRPAAKAGDTLLAALPGRRGIALREVLFVGLGGTEDGERESRARLQRIAAAAARRVAQEGPARCVVAVDDFVTPCCDAATVIEAFVLAFDAATYVYAVHHTEHESHPPRPTLEHVGFVTRRAVDRTDGEPDEHGSRPTQNDPADLAAAIARAAALVAGLKRARDIGNAPPNLCDPQTLAEHALELAKAHPRLDVEILDEQALARLGANAILAVGRGSARPPRLIRLTWRGADGAPIALVGKGITFDTGGISLKPSAEMDEMKFDLGGAAAVLGTLETIARENLPLHVVGVIAAAENMPDGNATRPGDIVKTLSGRTVEILNTDAEGRLVLCDALTYTERFEPDCIIDLATLTGACIIALGHQASALLANDDALADELLAAAEASADRAWRLPLWPEYGEQLKSNFADLANIGGRPAGTITAAYFLSRFVQKQRWAHLDIAGVAWKSGKEKGATGRPIPLLVEFLRRRARAEPPGASGR